MSTYMAKPNEVERKWYVVDATGKTLGRLASEVAKVLRGKHKPTFTPHVDVGDFVIVINAEKVKLTGKKLQQKKYYRHTGYPGGLKTIDYDTLLQENPEKAVQLAVKGMLPHTRLGRKMLKKLKVYRGAEHPHQAQKPEVWDVQA
ncbi:MAG: 50S ribosomal protein L13 [Thermoanaerobacteraceae bacterium]|nr:50S ribosomal protein L13 [Thermoanaerobacteraceae bacterium]